MAHGQERVNRLEHEQSTYLRQHARNPVDWYPWGPEALERAAREDKPIFLSIGYSSCHWCHVMEEDVFEDDETARLLNLHFVPIKVDREERPDLDAVYMRAVQAMTGGGGWPMSVFLTPEQKPFFGGTYFPRDHFVELLRRIHNLYTTDRNLLESQAIQLHRALSKESEPEEGPVPGIEAIKRAAARERQRFDQRWGGVGTSMKFPTPLRWLLLLHLHRRTGDADAARMVRTTLDAMASGGIHDQVGGGFHRYAVDPVWLVPHFEKMLYDNALLASLYLEAGAVFDHRPYLDTARDVLDFLLRDMRDEGGALYASYDADSGGVEGSYYLWSPGEIQAVAGPDDGAVLAAFLGVTERGNFEGKSIPTRRATDLDGEGRQVFQKYREALRARRAERTPPVLDRKVVTAWNGLVIAALAQGHAALGDKRYLDAARDAAAYLWDRHRRQDGGLFRVSNEGEAAHEGILDDYAFFAHGLLELFQASGETVWLERTSALAGQVRTRFLRPAGGFYLTPEDHEAPMGRHTDLFDHAEPSGNAVMLHVLLRLSSLTGDRAPREEARRILAGHAGLMDQAGLDMAWWHDAALLAAGPYHEVIIAGDPQAEDTRALKAAVRRTLPPYAALATFGPDGPTPEQAALMPPAAGKTAADGRATAYLCRQGTCNQPTPEPATLFAQLHQTWKI